MKLSKLIPQTKKAGMVTIAVVAGLVVGGLGVTQSEAAMDWLGLEQKLENHDQQLDNHDDRITNVEKDVETVQENTATPPATERVVVREVVTQNPAVANTPEPEAPKPAPAKVTAITKVVIDENRTDCKYIYSDGTTEVVKWKWSFINSHGLQQTNTEGFCDSSVIGQEKPN